jgi:hypothetical protein
MTRFALCGALHLFARLHSLIGGPPRPSPQGYDAIKISRNAWDSNFCDVNSKFLAVILEAQVRGVGSARKTDAIPHARTRPRKPDQPPHTLQKG